MDPKNYFISPSTVAQKQYEALRAFFVDNMSVKNVADNFGYTPRTVNSLVADFKKIIKNYSDNSNDSNDKEQDPFFRTKKKGRKQKTQTQQMTSSIVEMRKKNLSVPEIKVALDAEGIRLSEKNVYLILKKEGFSRLPRRDKETKLQIEYPKIQAQKSTPVTCESEKFNSNMAAILCFLPYLQQYGLIKTIEESKYPHTKHIDKISSILAFQALKLSNIRRYSCDDLWCMDRGTGLFAALNVLPKNAWYSSYSHRVTRDMNISFLKSLHQIWLHHGFFTDTFNLDFVTIPYWGDDSHLENNWSGKRRQSLASILAVLAQDPDSGIIDYGDTDILHKDSDAVILEFLDFYKTDSPTGEQPKYLVFDSKFTTYQNLNKLDKDNIKFLTIRIRGRKIVRDIEALPKSNWKKVRVMNADGKGRTLRVNEQKVSLPGIDRDIRQIAITGHGKIKPALIITNEFDLSSEDIIRKYSRRWLVEKAISEQIEFFHLNRLSSSIVIKVDFDLTMTILAHNLYRLLAIDLNRYSNFTSTRLFEMFISNSGEIEIGDEKIEVKLKKKRNLPTLITAMNNYRNTKISFLKNKTIEFSALAHT